MNLLPTLRVYPSLAKASHQQGLFASYAVSVYAFACDKEGRFDGVAPNTGCIDYRVFCRTIEREMGLKSDSLRKRFTRGIGLFWDLVETKHGRMVRLKGRDATAATLGVCSAGRVFAEGTLDKYSNRAFRGLALGAFAPRSLRHVSRSGLAQRSNISSSTQRRCERDGLAGYSGRGGVAPVFAQRNLLDLTLALNGERPTDSHARELNHFGYRGHFVTGQRLVRQAPKEFESDLVFRRRSTQHRKSASARFRPFEDAPRPAVKRASSRNTSSLPLAHAGGGNLVVLDFDAGGRVELYARLAQLPLGAPVRLGAVRQPTRNKKGNYLPVSSGVMLAA